MKRIVPLFLVMVLALCFAGCAGNNEPIQTGYWKSDSEAESGISNGEIIEGKSEERIESGEIVPEAALDESGKYAMEGEPEAIPAPGDPGSGENSGGIQYSSGTLTCGEYSDLEALTAFRELFNKSDVWQQGAETYKCYAYNSFTVNVTAADGLPAFNVPVYLLQGEDGATICIARTDINGRAVLTYSDSYAAEKDKLTVQVDGVNKGVGEELTFTVANGTAVQGLDLMFMIDTTGSMSDELEYLKVEFRNVIQRICNAAPDGTVFTVRTSVNFYRDEGDEYVLRSFDFTGDVNESLANLSAQFADGGGDFPEAVHTALADVVDHEWREDAVKLCFLVLDAPCHTDAEVQGVSNSINRSLNKAEAQGIRIIPIASSGISEEAEMMFRSYAVQTGGTYIFLTNHSGVGGDHKDPTDIQDYEVELLNECMVRVVSEYCGLRYVKPEQ